MNEITIQQYDIYRSGGHLCAAAGNTCRPVRPSSSLPSSREGGSRRQRCRGRMEPLESKAKARQPLRKTKAAGRASYRKTKQKHTNHIIYTCVHISYYIMTKYIHTQSEDTTRTPTHTNSPTHESTHPNHNTRAHAQQDTPRQLHLFVPILSSYHTGLSYRSTSKGHCCCWSFVCCGHFFSSNFSDFPTDQTTPKTQTRRRC